MKTKTSCLIIIAALLVSACGVLGNRTDDASTPTYLEGEVLIQFAEGYGMTDFSPRLDELGLTWTRPLVGGYGIEVPEGTEPRWVETLSQEPMIRDARLNQFGYRYEIYLDNGRPRIAGDHIIAGVSYGGCEREHVFQLAYARNRQGSFDVWLLKRTPDQACRMLVTEDVKLALPRELQRIRTLTFVAPDSRTFELKR